ncbi:ATP-binding protein [Paenibacillus sp. CF384]|uniref:ATP-binding protein n=1 Tax=Paenibacillus sp. CF384 TaxID=1884382 RepID=UPI00089D6ADD|nr:ATP-binding protein [Paenibacillus sp. CF384]SDW54940.1 ATPase family associated with various cellular activities (AAA) [Paenibacillus sp. CF384]
MKLQPYTSGLEHWSDELRKLDLMIAFKLQCKIELEGDENPLDPMRGLLITDDEVQRLLRTNGNGEAEVTGELPSSLAGMQDEITELSEIIAERLRLAEESADGWLPALVLLVRRFNLNRFEQAVVVMALAPEYSRKYEKLYGYLQDDVTNKLPTVDLALRLLCDSETERYSARSSFQADQPLLRWLLTADEGDGTSTLARPLRLDGRVVSFLLEAESCDGRLEGWVNRFDGDAARERDGDGEAEELQPLLIGASKQGEMRRFAELHLEAGKPAVLHLYGAGGSGKQLHAKHLAAALNRPLLLLHGDNLEAERLKPSIVLHQLFREAKLTDAIVGIAGGDHFMAPDGKLAMYRTVIEQWIRRSGGLLLWLSRERAHYSELPVPRQSVIYQVELTPPTIEEQRMLWRIWGEESAAASESAEAMADKFRLSPGQINRAVHEAKRLAEHEGADYTEEMHFERGAAVQLNHELEKKAKKLNPRYTFEDLILPHEHLDLLRQACNMMKYRRDVYGTWGFDRKLSYGKGLSMMFAGPPGTGKTMAAEVAANELRLEAYKIDLSQVISKYIGETEKNLHEIFKEAQRTNAILFFDESDALFGKRSEVKDAHDKYANVETAYLLQKMEEYEGVSILATNFQQNIDDAFLRRINIVVKFPFPDAEHREKLWRTMFPAATPLASDVDFAALAARIEVAGGNIKNIVLTAAFMAAAAGRPVGMRELVASARQELKKTGKILVNSEWDSFF